MRVQPSDTPKGWCGAIWNVCGCRLQQLAVPPPPWQGIIVLQEVVVSPEQDFWGSYNYMWSPKRVSRRLGVRKTCMKKYGFAL